MHPPCQPPNFSLVGRDSDGIGAVVFYEELDGPAQIEVHLVAVATRYRRRGGGWADETMSVLFDTLTDRALELGVHQIAVLTWIDEGNRASQALCRRFGLRQTGVSDSTLQRWAGTILVGGASADP
jgi:hypothetical protein